MYCMHNTRLVAPASATASKHRHPGHAGSQITLNLPSSDDTVHS